MPPRLELKKVLEARDDSAMHPTDPKAALGSDKNSSSKASPLEPLLPDLAPSGRIAARLLALLTSSAVRKGSLEQMEFARCCADLLARIERCVRTDKPVQLTLMAFPFKVPNPAKVGSRRMPDLAELAVLVRLRDLNAQAKSIYPPGLEIHIIHDGSYIADVFGVTLQEVHTYETYFARLVRASGTNAFLRLHDLHALWDVCPRVPRQQAINPREAKLDRRLTEKEWKNRFSKTLGMLNLRGLTLGELCQLLDRAPSGHLPQEYSNLERSVRVAMQRYYERDWLLHEYDPRPVCFPDAIHVTTQCRPRRLAIWLVSRGNSLLPWHGVGVIQHSGKWSVALARDVVSNPSYQPVFFGTEDVPFFYRQVAQNARASRVLYGNCVAGDPLPGTILEPSFPVDVTGQEDTISSLPGRSTYVKERGFQTPEADWQK